ncbi:MAG TPA: hypothetical protein HPP89_05670, partial [Gammaproteobacteria bacterium]|nr:hypothetical protein [Gammaproteobacteria bacterium]
MMETIREHLWRVLLGWSELLGKAPVEAAMAGVMLIQQQLQQTLTAGTSLSLLAPVL